MIPTLTRHKHPDADVAICVFNHNLPDGLPERLATEIRDTPTPSGSGRASVRLHQQDSWRVLAVALPNTSESSLESLRIAGAQAYDCLKNQGWSSVHVHGDDSERLLAFAEGLASKNYRFDAHKSKKDAFALSEIRVPHDVVSDELIKELHGLLRGVFFARDLVNEPANILTAPELSHRIEQAGKEGGYKVDVFGKAKIESLKMGGILSVNQGSKVDPTFTIIEYRPEGARNDRPVVLVGKGIVYDSGGLSLKPTANSMDIMKSDMGGAAAVAGAIHAAALNDLPVHIIGLIPATDNCIGPEAYGPGDVISLYDGTTVEVMNTDAEGRLVLADALAYAKKYDPELVVDLATLTGASMRALGYLAAATMGTADESTQRQLMDAATHTAERLVAFPLWDEYNDELDSDIADLRNVGRSPLAGSIVAGKFLQRFTDYPWLHIDIAGPSFLADARGYLPKGATGFGSKLIFQFLKDRYEQR